MTTRFSAAKTLRLEIGGYDVVIASNVLHATEGHSGMSHTPERLTAARGGDHWSGGRLTSARTRACATMACSAMASRSGRVPALPLPGAPSDCAAIQTGINNQKIGARMHQCRESITAKMLDEVWPACGPAWSGPVRADRSPCAPCPLFRDLTPRGPSPYWPREISLTATCGRSETQLPR